MWTCSIHRGPSQKTNDVLARHSDSQRRPLRVGLRGLPATGSRLAAAADVYGVRSRRMLRLVPEQARDQALPDDTPSDRSFDRTRRRVGLVLRRSAVVRTAAVWLTAASRRFTDWKSEPRELTLLLGRAPGGCKWWRSAREATCARGHHRGW